ncbi:hypothetical protein OVY48_09970 [Sphingobium sp. SA2]|uniref:hypothetical protein n=1 Tax=Sphingobium sp. SA2 TaxID=1524832 RepID=UPI0028C107BF|nr:hypothetical protein [Sphingobium sp. SA2]MDT7533750.1 hypothetical protein [Sphingobium sp. SA2]
MSERLTTHELIALMGEDAFVALTEAFGGRRLYVPGTIAADHDISRAIGADAATRLSERIAPDVIRVPLARDLRARRYRAAGLSNGAIATRLGITEPAVNKLFKRSADLPAKGAALQLGLFPED